MNRKPCQRCNDHPVVKGERYCSLCKKTVLAEMKESGYLSQERPPSVFNDARGRKQRDTSATGGSAEMGTDGDNW